MLALVYALAKFAYHSDQYAHPVGAWAYMVVLAAWMLLTLVSTGIGYVMEVARSSERALSRALRIEAATRERERLARDIHDGVLQVLAMVQRRGNEIGGEAAELGRMAGEQEAALRTLVAGDAARTPVPGRQAPAERADVPQTGPVDLCT